MNWTAGQPLTGPIADVVARWHAGDRFGILCTGDALLAEEAYRSLAPTADRAFGNADAVGPEDVAAAVGDRVVALAWDVGDVHPALLRRCTAILHFGAPVRMVARALWTHGDVVAPTVRVLQAAGVADHGLELAAARMAVGLQSGGCGDPVRTVRALVADPRRTVGAPESNDDWDHAEDQVAQPPDPADAADAEDETFHRTDGDDHESGQADETQADSDWSREDSPTGEPMPAQPADDAGAEAQRGDEKPPDGAGEVEGIGSDPVGASAAQSGGGQATAAQSGDGADQRLGGHPPGMTDSDLRRTLEARLRRRMPDALTHMRGRRGARSSAPEHGPIVRVVPIERAGGRIAVMPTLHRAALRYALGAEPAGPPGRLRREDLRGALRRRRGGNHTVIVVDGSSSLGPSGISRAGAVTDQALASIAARRGIVSVIVAAGQSARVVLERSTSLAQARHALETASTGGGTPLAGALGLALAVLADDETSRRRVLLITDGRPTVGLSGTHLPTAAANLELSRMLTDLTSNVPDVALLPVGLAAHGRSGNDLAPFAAAGVRIG